MSYNRCCSIGNCLPLVYIVGALGARVVRVVTAHRRWSVTSVVLRVWALSLNTFEDLITHTTYSLILAPHQSVRLVD
jgi:hypothetical protein